MSRISSVASESLRKVLGNRCLTKVALAIDATAAATIQSAGEINFTVGGVFFTKAALNDQSIAPTHRFNGAPVTTVNPAYVQPVSTKVIYVVALNAAGTVAIVQGSFAGQKIVHNDDLSKVGNGTGDIPQEPDGYTAIGFFEVATNGATTFTPGTTALNAAGVTVVYTDVSVLPA